MFVAMRVAVDVTNLLVEISLHAPADWRIELGEVTDLQSSLKRQSVKALKRFEFSGYDFHPLTL